MDQQAIGPAWVAIPIVAAFAINMFAEWLLLSSERRFYVALGKSLKAIIIPALIATYALIIAGVIAGPDA